jgi:hypothetical protein
MRSVLSTELGAELYTQRAQLIEPIFGNTKHNQGFTRFHRRGRSAARTEWRLMATTHTSASRTSTSTAREADRRNRAAAGPPAPEHHPNASTRQPRV